MQLRIVSVFSLILLLSGFVSCLNDDSDYGGNGTYVFVEQLSNSHGELISGPEPPLLMIDFPTYSFDADSGKLTGVIDFEINNELKLILGSGHCLDGTAGGGCGTGLSGVYSIPYHRGNFELLKLEESGKIVFEYLNEVHSLEAGQEWTSEIIHLDTVEFDGKISISKITETDRITNFGKLNKKDITVWKW